ncbi:MAG: ThiF family adenylyltransferase [Bryobacteraceae bacterium]
MGALHLVDHTKDRYHALSISSVWELEKLRRARALVIGAGALGNEVSKNLVMMGVRAIAILDRDTVEMANLSRSIFFRESDHGRSKAKILAERLREVNADVPILPLDGDLDEILGLGLVRRMDMIFSCLDSRLARRSLNRMCERLGKPWVDGSMENLLGEIIVYAPDLGPCYECNMTLLEKQIISEIASCRVIAVKNLALGKVPTTSTMGSIVGAMQVQEGVKLLHGDFKRALIGKRLVVNSECNDIYATALDRKDGCDGHFRFGPVTEVPEFTADTTSASDILARFRYATGQDGLLELGREIVTEVRCPKCNSAEVLGRPVRSLTDEQARCPGCDEPRILHTTHIVRGSEAYASFPLSGLGIPRLDILEVRGKTGAAWYELTGDLEHFPEAIQPMPAAPGKE